MEVVCKSDYQDIYRVTGGVLLVINKFDYMSFENNPYPIIYSSDERRMYKRYAPGCQNALKILKEDYIDYYRDWGVPVGTVAYYDRPVRLLDDREDWEYQIKTSGECFKGTADEIIRMLEDIKDLIADDQDQGDGVTQELGLNASQEFGLNTAQELGDGTEEQKEVS